MTLRSISLSHYFFYETQIYISQFSLEHFLPREYFFRDLKFNIPPSEAHQFPLQATHLHWFLISDNSFTTYHIVQMRNLSISFGLSYSPLLLSRQALSVLCNLHSCAHCLGPGPSVRCPSLGLKIWGKWYRVKGVYNLFVVVPEAAVRVRGPLETVSHSVAFLGWYLTSSISWFPSNFWAWSSSLPVYPLYVLNYSDRFLFCHLFRVDSGCLQPGVLVDPRSNWNSWNTGEEEGWGVIKRAGRVGSLLWGLTTDTMEALPEPQWWMRHFSGRPAKQLLRQFFIWSFVLKLPLPLTKTVSLTKLWSGSSEPSLSLLCLIPGPACGLESPSFSKNPAKPA